MKASSPHHHHHFGFSLLADSARQNALPSASTVFYAAYYKWCSIFVGQIFEVGLFPGGKADVRGVDHSPISSAEVKESVELLMEVFHPLI
jgi:hypothetical protein